MWRYFRLSPDSPLTRLFLGPRPWGNTLLFDALKRWWSDRKIFPTRWLSYRTRLADDIEYFYRQEGGPEFFNKDFRDTLEDAIQRLESWQIKIYASQYAILTFLAISIFSNDSSFSILGVSLKNSPGVKEILLIASTTLAFLAFIVTFMKDLRVAVVERLVLLQTDSKFSDFAQIAHGNSFFMRLYITKPFRKWIFPTPLNTITFVAAVAVLLMALVLIFGLMFAFQVYIFADIYFNSTVYWPFKYAVLAYGALAVLFGLFCLIKLWLPLPYRDKQILFDLEQLRTTNPAAYAEGIRRLFGDN